MRLNGWKRISFLTFSILFIAVLQVHATAPSITSLSPTSGAVGASVTITGTNFGAHQGTSTVKFNGTTATATSWSTTSIVAPVPTGATTGNVVVTVSGAASNGMTFTVVAAPSITNLSSTTGAVGAAVTVTGTNFGSSQGSGTVKFNGTTASVTSWSATSIGVTVPSGATTGNVVVFASGVNSNGVNFTMVAAPNITSLSITTGAVGAAVTITGTNFGSSQGSGTVNFNGTLASVTSWGATGIGVTVPSGATTGNVVVFASGVNSNGVNFTVAPGITSLSTTTGAVGASVTITGTSFGSPQGTSTVKFNGTTATATSWSATSIVTTVPTGATTGNVVVTVSGVASNGSSFTVVPAPNITSLSITTGAVGAAVTVTGTSFGSSQGSGSVSFNGTAASVTSWSATSIGVTVPSGATTGNVVVFASGVNSNGSSFTVVAAPNITSLSISTGAVGAAVTITGAGFGSSQGSGTVKFNATAANVASWGPTSIAVTVPSGATTGNVVVFASGVNSNGSTFTVVAAPSITSLSPTSGAVGAAVTVTGTNFGSAQGSGSVSFNGTAASATSWTATSIGVTVPSGATTGNVVVSASGVNSNGSTFAVLPTLSITRISPTSGPVSSTVEITGTNFGATQGSGTVSLNGTGATLVTWTDTAIVVLVPSGATSGPFSVTADSQTANSSSFTVTTLPLGWSDGDVGSVGVAGSATFANGTFTVKGSGFIGNTADIMHFAYQPLSGDGTIVARVVSVQGSSSATAGLMIRETLNPNAANAYTCYFATYGYMMFYDRTSTGGATNTVADVPGVTLPYWLKLVRSGNTFSIYSAPNGLSWTQMGASQTITMVQNVYVGLAVADGSNSVLATATFDNVSINSAAAPAPVITSVSATTGSVGSEVVITGAGFGASQGTSLVTLNTTPVTINSWNSTSIMITIPTGATTGFLVVSVAPSMNDSNPVFFTVTPQPLPAGWLDLDMGSVGVTGSATFASGVFTVKGSGNGIWSTADAMHFVYQPLPGDGTIVARVASIVGGSEPQAGVMIRETLNANATNAYAYYWANYGMFVFYDRTTTGGSTGVIGDAPGTAPPYWVKLVRSGNLFSAYVAPDGVNWQQMGTSQTITMAQNVYIGLAVSSDSTSNLATATLDNVSFTAGLAPLVTSLSPSAGPAGMAVTINGESFGTSQGTSTVAFTSTPAASVTAWSNNQIVATAPSTVRTGPIVVTVNSVASNSNVIFTAYNPVINSLAPPAAELGGGGQITLNGYGFGVSQGSSTVQFNSVTAGVVSWSDSSVAVNVPSNATSGPVTLTVNGVTSNGVQFTVIENITISTISPTAGPIGTPVTITGTGFGAAQSNSTATFNGTTAAISSWSDTQIVAVVPAGAATGTVTVEVADVTAQGPVFTINSTVQLTDSLGHQSSYTSAMVGGKWYVSNVQGSGCSSCTVRGSIQTTYDSYGNVVTRTDELGRVTTYAYDPNNNVTSISQPAVSGGTPRTTYSYNSFGEVLTVTDPLGHITTNTYDANGNLLTVTSPSPDGHTAASVTQFAYNSLGELTQITDPLGRITKLTYTPVGLVATITDPQQNVTTYQYDAHGNRTSVTDAMQNQTTFAYDTGDRLTTITYPGGIATTTFTYDYRGRRITATDQNSKTTTYAYDDADRLTSVTDAATNVTHYAYDTENNLLTITDANTHATTFAYDAFGRVTQTTFPSNLFETYAYDAANNLTSKTDRKNQTIQYVYDALNRLTQKSYPDTTSVNYIYDLASKAQQVNDPTGTYGFTYDNMARLVGTSTQYAFLTGTFTNSYSYDGNSNRTGFTAPDSSTNTYTYDTLNRLSTLANSWAGSFGFSYDALSRRTQMTRPNNVATNYSYDNQSRLLSVLHQLSGSTIDGATYTVDSAGNRTAKTDNRANVTSNYGYDAVYQLLQTTQGGTTRESYTYDPVGNRLSSLGVSPYSNNSSNELTSTPSASYTYDNNGNMLTKTATGSTTNYTWDYENRLATLVLPGTGGTATFKYDPFGRRIQKAFTQNSTTTTTNYAYDDASSVQDIDQNGNLLARYTETLNVDEPLAESRSGTTSYYEADGLGSVTSLSSTAGALTNTYTYDSFGKMTASTGSVTNRFQYTAREFDTETGLYYYRARYYDPQTGRFLREDPSRFITEWNLYSYVGNEPIGDVDQWGLQKGTLGDISNTAASNVGHDDWLFRKSKNGFGPDTDKCNLFVYNMISDAGAGQSVPLRHVFFGGPPAAEDWADRSRQFLGCWKIVNGPPQPGDVIAMHTGGSQHPHWAHVGIFVGTGTASANTAVSPAGIITINDWGLRPGDNPVVRRCTCCEAKGGGKK